MPVSLLPFEPTPDARTVTPLVVDIMSFKDKLRKQEDAAGFSGVSFPDRLMFLLCFSAKHFVGARQKRRADSALWSQCFFLIFMCICMQLI